MNFLIGISLFFMATMGAVTGTSVGVQAAQAQTLQKTLEKYSQMPSIQFEIKKTDEKVILGTTTESTGILKYQKSRLYISQNGSKKTELFYADKVLTLVEHPDTDFGDDGKRKVTVIKKNIPPLVTSLLNLFSNPKNFTKEFSVVSQSESEGVYVATLKPKSATIKNLSLKVNTSDLSLTEMSFVDDVDTKTTLSFSNLKTNKKMNRSEFQYKPSKTDEVLNQ
ncbi:LolA family protein [Pseudobdellovibrio exovorus]|uniref:Outer membrane lipoprotein carrier protein n=1 Tax=Pseudobdellovibrio exovorus JSS TaxID=1184267 RepID=M4VBX5_9BACT|nr:outer-membrane lipoprotein carrier protein LolA [Pseudobdellovibrio exovorus]AGH96743.1 outer membrane lipoprotein carrier protein [Pseudobdellovibrio exovorus JSS]